MGAGLDACENQRRSLLPPSAQAYRQREEALLSAPGTPFDPTAPDAPRPGGQGLTRSDWHARRAAILDTNVFVAAGFKPSSRSARIVDAVRAGRLRMVWNDATRREIERVLSRIPPLRGEDVSELFRDEDRYT